MAYKQRTFIALTLVALLVSGTSHASVETDPWTDFCRAIDVFFKQLLEKKQDYRFEYHNTAQHELSHHDIKTVRTAIKRTIKKLNADYASETDRITKTLLATLNADNLHEFRGASLDEKVNHEMTKIYVEQKAALKEAHKKKAARSPSKINKLYTSEDCCVCLESFSSKGSRYYLDPCGHDICPNCYTHLEKKECPQCRTPIARYEDVSVQSDHNPETDAA